MRDRTSYRHIATAISLVSIDQVIKILVAKYTNLATYNTGGAFGVGYDIGFYKILSLILLLVVIYAYFLVPMKFKYPMVFIASGALSNQIDRFFKIGVVDYINPIIWPSFNIADSLIFIGVCFIAYELLFSRERL